MSGLAPFGTFNSLTSPPLPSDRKMNLPGERVMIEIKPAIITDGDPSAIRVEEGGGISSPSDPHAPRDSPGPTPPAGDQTLLSVLVAVVVVLFTGWLWRRWKRGRLGLVSRGSQKGALEWSSFVSFVDGQISKRSAILRRL